MFNLFDFCSLHWIWPWLLPFLLGLGLGWLIWGRLKSIIAELENKINGLNAKIRGLELDLENANKARMEAEGNIALYKGQLRECQESKAGDTIKLSATNVAAPVATMAAAAMPTSSISTGDKWGAAIGTDNLQIVEGIGPKMEEVLKENGITNFGMLANSSPQSLRDILDKYGDKYRIIDPKTWPQQAALAVDGQWNDLITLQKQLDTGRSDTVTTGETDSKLEKWLIKARIIRRWQQDDLKAIEGIGPKIESLLNNAGINTWQALSETSSDRIKEILDNAGPNYALADPGTWPKQAEMAAQGKWDELDAYQDFLNGGKEK